MTILVLATAPVPIVERAVAAARRRAPSTAVVVVASETDSWRYTELGYSAWTSGEQWLDLDAPGIRARVGAERVAEIVIPLSVPRRSMLFVARLVRDLPRIRVRLELGGRWGVSRRLLVLAGIIVATFVVYAPISVAIRLGSAADGLLLLALLLSARLRPLGERRSDPDHGPICHVITNLGTGGAQRQLMLYLRSISGSPKRVHLLALWDYNELFLGEVRDLGVEVEIVARQLQRSPARRAVGRLLPHVSILVLLLWRLRSLRPRAVMCWLFLANVIGAAAARWAGVPRVVSAVRNLSAWKTWPGYRRWWYRLADRWAVRLNDTVVANAEAVAEDFCEWAGCPPGRVEVVRNAVDVDGLTTAPARDLRATLTGGAEGPVILTIGRLAEEKNHAALLRAAAELKRRGVDHWLVIAGHGELEGPLQGLARDLGIADRVRWFGKVSDPQSLYRAADLFVLTSRVEGMPNVVLEAQALGVPVVTVRVGGAAEVVVDGETGVVVAPGDDYALVEAMERLALGPDLRRRMATSSVERMRRCFSPVTLVAAIDRLTGRTVEGGDDPRR